jgi:hypothetical protein
MKPSWILGLVFARSRHRADADDALKTQDLASDATSPDARRAADRTRPRRMEQRRRGAQRSAGGAAPKRAATTGDRMPGEHARNSLPGSSVRTGRLGRATPRARRRPERFLAARVGRRENRNGALERGRRHAQAERRSVPTTAEGSQRRACRGDPDDENNTDDSDVAYDSGAGKVFDTASQVEIKDAGPINGGAGTISFWVDPQWAAHSPEDATFVQLGNGDLQIVKDGDLLRFQFLDRNGMQNEGVVDIGEWQTGDSRNVIASWQGGMFTLFVDGAQAFMNYAPSPPAFVNGTNLFAGSA